MAKKKPTRHYPIDEKDKGGRPIKYTKELLDELADKFIAWSNRPDTIYFKRFCLENNIPVQYMAELCALSERFSEAYKHALEMQETKMIEGSISKAYSSHMSQFVLINKHGWRSKEKDQDSSETDREAVSAVIKHLADAVKNKG